MGIAAAKNSSTLAKQIALLIKDCSGVNKDVSRLKKDLGKIKKLVGNGKSMPSVAVCKYFDEFQNNLDLLEHRKLATKSDIASLKLGVTALKWFTTVTIEAPGVITIQGFMGQQVDVLGEVLETVIVT